MPIIVTTIQLQPETRARLDDLKVYPRETYDAVLNRLLDAAYDPEPLSEETLKKFEEGIADMRAGRGRPLRGGCPGARPGMNWRGIILPGAERDFNRIPDPAARRIKDELCPGRRAVSPISWQETERTEEQSDPFPSRGAIPSNPHNRGEYGGHRRDRGRRPEQDRPEPSIRRKIARSIPARADRFPQTQARLAADPHTRRRLSFAHAAACRGRVARERHVLWILSATTNEMSADREERPRRKEPACSPEESERSGCSTEPSPGDAPPLPAQRILDRSPDLHPGTSLSAFRITTTPGHQARSKVSKRNSDTGAPSK